MVSGMWICLKEKTQTNVYKSKEWLDNFFKDINDINNDTKDTTINQKTTLRDARQAAWFYFCWNSEN